MEVNINEVKNLLKEENVEILDVREPQELVDDGYIEGTHHIPMSEFDVETVPLDKSKKYYVMCLAGGRSARVVEYMEKCGFDATNLEGGIKAYTGEKLYK
ncbi:rhodanese-like domain-containing protein [Phocicoccus pinnipedialis]|uniref:Thiosulfate sulfurtransferase GlpE n=1 Tax=Phocicoccus pinnipedialis TaxID=110845 RepID=A0A6V7RIE6_9BACL|nr:rhodanese-like domain-containing protein [Jeotgalicoccus pinnipedialis]MBP1939072.1 rhodanese-related sulfurtransferase [Jeotgalicoccus pinnipedialis]CAD2076921.1 Thiosulfate sulfurtransferase GlpE [Jeotgalicoccus pinnipedialis]